MERRAFQTPVGEIWLRGEAAAFSDARPLVLVILGAFARPDGFTGLQSMLPEAAVLVAHLPGQHSPPLSATSVGTFAFAFDHVVRSAFSARRVVVCGSSIGGVVALGMNADVTRLAIDPPLHTACLWPVLPLFRKIYEREPAQREFLTNVFGLTSAGVEERDYTGVLGRPARVLIAGEPLMPERPIDEVPGAISEADRTMMLSRPELRVTVVLDAGHLIGSRFPGLVVKVLRDLLAEEPQSSG